MKLTKRAHGRISRTLRNLERAHTYIHRDDMALCARGGPATTTLHFTRADGSVLYEVQRAYGSDLCGLDFALAEIRAIVESGEV